MIQDINFNDGSSAVSISKRTTADLIAELTRLHNLLCDISHSVQKYFGNQIVFIITVDFFNIAFHCYYVLEILLGKEEYFKTLNEYEVIATILLHVSLRL